MRAITLDPGQMSARLELEIRHDVSDGQGGVVTGFSVVTSLWARIVPASSGHEERADEQVFTVTHRIWIRVPRRPRGGHAVSQGPADLHRAGLSRSGRNGALSGV